MLKIEKINITGFKSFADSTEIRLGDGITTIVGPNGCGKSNVSDAISWVLGEQSAKSLRGTKMEDVIFSGTKARKPVGMAEVTLTLVAIEDIAPRTEVDDIELPDSVEMQIPETPASTLVHTQKGGEGVVIEPEPAPGDPESQDGQQSAGATDGEVSAEVAAARPKVPRYHRARQSNPAGPILMAGERVTIGRRLYRSGESDYIMNGRACRLRDIHDLFAGTGLGTNNYAIIEQGRIGQILSSKPQDRRTLIEEAAGITKFKSRKRAAELRLDSARQNLFRLNDIVSEVERQIGSLKRQAAKARRYRRLREEMRALLRDVFAADWERLEVELDRLEKLADRSHEEQEVLAARLSERDAEHRAASLQAREAEEALAQVRDRASALELEADRARNRHSFLREQIAELMMRREEISRDRERIADRLALIADERERKSEQHKELSAETDAEAAKLAEQESAYQSRLRVLAEREKSLEAIRTRLMAEVGRTERLRNQQTQLEDAERRLGLDGARLDREAAQASTRRDEASRHLAELADEMQMSQARLDELRQAIVQRVEALAAARSSAAEAVKRLRELEERRSARAHRLSSLEDLDARHAYYSDAVQQVLSLEGNTFNAIGTLADLADVEPTFEPALESLFGRELQSILVPGLDDALSGVEYLVSTGAGRAAFLVVAASAAEVAASARVNGGGGARTALSLMRLPKPVADAVARAYPEKASAIVVDTVAEAIERSRAAGDHASVFVTVAGELVVNGRVVVGGSATAQGAHLLGLKREIKEIRSELERIVWEVGSAEAEVTETRRAVTDLEAESGELDSTLRADEKTAIERTMRQKQLESDFERAEQHIRVVDSERKRLVEEADELAARRTAVAAEMETAAVERQQVEADLASAQQGLSELRGEVEVDGRQLAEARAVAAARQERRRAVQSELRRLGEEEADLVARRDRNQIEGVEIESRIEQLSGQVAETEGQSELYSTERAGMDEALEVALTALNEVRHAVDAMETEIAGMRERLDDVRAKGTGYEVERARLLSDAEHVRRGAASELSQSIEEVVESARAARVDGPGPVRAVSVDEAGDETDGAVDFDDDLPLPADPAEAARARLDQIRRKVESLGAVNMMALEELEEAETRFVFLTTQRKDVLDSIAATENALSEIKRRSRQKFRDAFAEINHNFTEMFQELFGGGRGEMVLLDEDDVLESGIDIIAQPPGKRLQNVLLLSGGEKAMTAIALVLAIFKYKPSPFCILDEVDAPLDEVNVGRFSDHIIEMSQTTQFLVITHSKRTMEAARALYGVTMEEPGVSKLVSVLFAEVKKEIEADGNEIEAVGAEGAGEEDGYEGEAGEGGGGLDLALGIVDEELAEVLGQGGGEEGGGIEETDDVEDRVEAHSASSGRGKGSPCVEGGKGGGASSPDRSAVAPVTAAREALRSSMSQAC